MLKDEFNRLIQVFQEAADGKPVNLEEVFGQSFAFFEDLKKCIANGTEEEKTEAIRLMSEMYQQMQESSRRICEASGMSQEQLVMFAENPANFTPEQWQTIQHSKEQIVHSGAELAQMLKKDASPQTGLPPPRKDSTPKPKAKKVDRSKWMRS
jgi:hypothetical protein